MDKVVSLIMILSGVAYADSAREHYAQGVAFYDAGRYQDAAREFTAAKRLEPRAAFDYNLGRALSLAGNLRGAIEAYGHYVDSDPQPPDAEEVRRRIEILRVRLEAQPGTVVGSSLIPESSAVVPGGRYLQAPVSPGGGENRTRFPLSWRLPVAVGGAGAVLLAASLVTGLVSHGIYAGLEARCAGGCSSSDAGAISTGGGLAVSSDVLLGVGVATVAAAAVIAVVERVRR